MALGPQSNKRFQGTPHKVRRPLNRDVESEDCKYYAYRYYEGEHDED